MLEKGADVNAQSGRALREASKRGRRAVMRLLLKNGAAFKLALKNGGEEDEKDDEDDEDDEDEDIWVYEDDEGDKDDEDDEGKALQPTSVDDHKEVIQLLLKELCLDSVERTRPLERI